MKQRAAAAANWSTEVERAEGITPTEYREINGASRVERTLAKEIDPLFTK